MSWEDQGRQMHGWFGHGTFAKDYMQVSKAEGAELRSRVPALVEFAADVLKAEGQPGADVVRAAQPALREMIPVWAGGIGFKADAFRQAFAGKDAHPVDAYRLQRVTLAVVNGYSYAGP